MSLHRVGQPAPALDSARLSLRRVPWDAVVAIVEGRRLAGWAPDYPDDGDRVIAAVIHRAADARSAIDPWGHRQVIERETDTVVGGIGFFGAPQDGAVEVGYGIVRSRQGRGYATEAVRTMVGWALDHDDLDAVIAATDASNIASQRVLAAAGFQLVENGKELRYTLRKPPGPPRR